MARQRWKLRKEMETGESALDELLINLRFQPRKLQGEKKTFSSCFALERDAGLANWLHPEMNESEEMFPSSSSINNWIKWWKPFFPET